MSAKGVDFHNGQILDAWRVISPLAGFGVSGTLLSLQKEIAGVAKSVTHSKNVLMRSFAYTQEYPVALSAAIDGYGIIGTAVSAAQHGDGQTLGILSLWGAGVIALGLSDPRIQKRLGYEPKPAVALAAPRGP